MKKLFFPTLVLIFFQSMLSSCSDQTKASDNPDDASEKGSSQKGSSKDFKEGEDYMVYDRVRLLDKQGFTGPQEAYSMLMPKGWQHEGEITWNAPGSSCAGTFRSLNAKSPDGKYQFEILPDVLYNWNTNQETMQFQQNAGGGQGSNCTYREPIEAEQYLRNIFASEIGNPEIVKVETNQSVIEQMRQMNAESMRELQSYGAGQMQFNQTAVNADVKWSDGTAGWVVLGVTIIETMVPNVYTGGADKIFTTSVSKRIVFKYPSGETDQAKNQFSVMMASIRTNPDWSNAVNSFWKNARQQSNVVHVGKIRAMDEQTRRIGEQAIRDGQQRLDNMDAQMRNWESRQASQDRMHTEFIKTIRGVENYSDASGKYEMASGYNHAWSRGDGSSFVLSDNPNFDPAFVFKDQSWKEMKKVH